MSGKPRPTAYYRHQEYPIFVGIISRCENPNRPSYKHYGAQGIKVSPLWRRDFWAFLRDVGPRPSPRHQIDRIDVNGHYEPGNVRWVLPIVQSNNKRRTRYVVYNGEKMSLCDAVRAAGSVIHYEAAWIRITHGWTVEKAVSTPRTKLSPNSKERRAEAA